MTSPTRRRSAALYAKKKRDAKKAAGRCIDEPLDEATHGEVHRGQRCKPCWDKSRKKAV